MTDKDEHVSLTSIPPSVISDTLHEQKMLIFVDKLIRELETNKTYIGEFKDLKGLRRHIRYKLKEFSEELEWQM